MATHDDPPTPSAPLEPPSTGVLNALPPGHRLQEYALESVLGYGGFGITYLATDRNLDCKVAIKEYLPADQAVRSDAHSLQPKSGDAREAYHWGLTRFLDEARALATFRHPNIVRVLRFFEANNSAYMVMELIGGLPLGEWVKRNRPVGEAKLLAVIRPILDGLAVIHAAGFVHRDIKPGNIHMRSDSDPVLLDFGAARRVVTQSGHELTAIVTPGYAAFEQYHSQGHQGPWTDIYSVAAVMYGIVTGQRPIEAPARVRHDGLPKALDAGDRGLYSAALLRAIDWALSPEEEKRPHNVQAFLQGLPDATGSPPGPAPLTPFAREGPDTACATPSVLADAAVVTALEAALAAHLGPMAAVLVRRAAKAQPSVNALRSALAQEIDNEHSRALFLDRTEPLLRRDPISAPPGPLPGATRESQPASAPPASVPALFEPAFLSAVETELAHHLGPLAGVLVRRTSAKARDRAELFLLLSDHIADANQRRAFIKKSVAAFKGKA
ncbi:MAG: serine/threonine protein kinase [Burkholderiales bacterium]|nr:serine/threonine protein kinase [Burkholderiales bacterium]